MITLSAIEIIFLLCIIVLNIYIIILRNKCNCLKNKQESEQKEIPRFNNLSLMNSENHKVRRLNVGITIPDDFKPIDREFYIQHMLQDGITGVLKEDLYKCSKIEHHHNEFSKKEEYVMSLAVLDMNDDER